MKPLLTRALLAVFVLAGFSPLPARGQQDDTPTAVTDSNRSGDLPFSATVGTSAEHVGVTSGSLVVSIPILNVKGRGMDFSYSLQYDSHALAVEPRQGNGQTVYVWNFELRNYLNNQGLWFPNQPFLTSTHYSKNQCYPDPNNPQNGTVRGANNYMLQDETGGKHPLLANFERATCTVGNGWVINNSGPDSGDEGIWGLASPRIPGTGVGSVLMNDGTSITAGGFSTPNVVPPGAVQQGFGFYTDPDGNLKTEAPGGFDTLGRNLISQQNQANQIIYTVTDSNGNLQTYTVNLQSLPVSTTFGVPGLTEYSGTRTVISSVALPNGQSYSIEYNNNGEIKQLTLPTGAVITYGYATLSNSACSYRYVSSRKLTVGSQVSNWTFSPVAGACTALTQSASKTVTVTDPLNNQSVYNVDSSGETTSAAIYQGSATGTPLRRYTIDYFDPSTGAPTTLVSRITTQLENGLVSKKEFDYDSFNYPFSFCTDGIDCTNTGTNTTENTGSRGNVVEIREFDWGTSANSLTLLRRTDKTYLHDTNSNYIAPNLVSKVLQDTVYDGGGNQVSQTQFEYDNYVAGDNPMQGTSGVAEHDDTGHSTGYTLRGNVTRVKKWRNTDGALLTTTYTFDDLGNILAVKDPLSHTTNYDYTDSFANGGCAPPAPTHAYVSTVTNALGQQSKIRRYPCTGLVQSDRDQNDITAGRVGTTYAYDLLGRITQKTDADGGTVNTSYQDTAPLTVTTSTQLSSTQSMTSVALLDGLGRTTQTQLTSDPQGTVFTDTTYDLAGRKSTVSNPYRATSDPTYGITTSQYDALGRMAQVAGPDGTVPSSTTPPTQCLANNLCNLYNGNTTTVTDQAGAPIRRISDALGRLTEVDEPGGVTSATPGEVTATVSGNELSVGGAAPTPATGSATSSGSERSIPGVAAAAGSGSATSSGTERNIPGTNASPGSGSVQITGSVESMCNPNIAIPAGGTCSKIYDSGTVSVTVNGFTASTSYRQGVSLTTILSNLSSQLAAAGSPVTIPPGSGSTISMVAKATGAASNYALFAQCTSNDPTDFPGGSFSLVPSGPTLTGGKDAVATTYDSGTVAIAINGSTYQTSYGQNSTSATIASALASAITGGTLANATANGSVISITAKTTGSATNYTLSCSSVTSQGTAFGANTTSFPFSPVCAASLAGGKDATATTYDSGTVAVTINGTGYQASYGQNSTSATIASALASAITAGTLAKATASGSVISITTTAAGSATNYTLSCSSVTSQGTAFGANTTSFPFSPTCAAKLSGGQDAGPVVYDTGTVTLSIDGTSYKVPYGQNDNSTTVANALAGAINKGTLATATPSGSSITITASGTGAATNYAVATSSASSQPASFPTPSFSASSGNLSGGTNANAGSLATPAVTLYSYDALGNLTCAVQKGTDTSAFTTCAAAPATWRPRSFTYDSLSELRTASNPETGTIQYAYNNDGVLTSKTDARNISINYSPTESPIDPLHRVTKKTFSNGDPAVVFGYDGNLPQAGCTPPALVAANPVGQATSMCDAAGAQAWNYDAVGRVQTVARVINGVSKTAGYTYNFDGTVSSETYPSGTVLNYAYNSAGRMISVADQNRGITYASGATYAPQGATASLNLGGSIVSKAYYNNRLQPCRIVAGTAALPGGCLDAASTGNILDLSYNFGNGTNDNGNVYAIANNRDATRTQTFTYDLLNRLTSAQNAGTNCSAPTANGRNEYWGNSYSYDVWGNLLEKTVTKCSSESMVLTSLASNRMLYFGYDAAGNLTNDGIRTYAFDAENRLTGASGFTYTYDGNGNRVEKSNGSTGTLYWYTTSGVVDETDMSGNLLHEYTFFNGQRVARKDSNGLVYYYFSDRLKTASVVTDSAGNVRGDSDYYPWGGELPIVANDSNHYKFTGKERDPETSLDDFGARYYYSAMGRFIQTDPVLLRSYRLYHPQRLNLYGYAVDNPMVFIDPTGAETLPVNLYNRLANLTQASKDYALNQIAGYRQGERGFAGGSRVAEAADAQANAEQKKGTFFEYDAQSYYNDKYEALWQYDRDYTVPENILDALSQWALNATDAELKYADELIAGLDLPQPETIQGNAVKTFTPCGFGCRLLGIFPSQDQNLRKRARLIIYERRLYLYQHPSPPDPCPNGDCHHPRPPNPDPPKLIPRS